MIYVDTSVVLAHLLAEDRVPPATLWSETLVSSRLLEYETWNRINARGLNGSHGGLVRDVLARVGFIELVSPALERALHPFPTSVRTLDALHLSSLLFIRDLGQDVRLASFDERQLATAAKLRIEPVSM